MARSLASLLGLLSALGAAAPSSPICKLIPGDAAWPQDAEWQSLNRTVGGRLIATVPAASICHTGGPFDGLYDAAKCEEIKPRWIWSSVHMESPADFSCPSLQNGSCDPFTATSKACELGNYVSFAINITGPEDVISGINFAKEKNLRLVIKNTGHDFLGKSTGKGGLSLWTRNLQTKEIIPEYSSPHYSGPAIRLGAGVLAYEAWEVARAAGFRVVGGECPAVGIAGGYTSGAGHSVMNSVYGMSADNVIEWEVVTADGEHVVANPSNEHKDLYWAITGGGPGTFGVVLSMTTRLHPDGPMAGASLGFNDETIGSDLFWEGVATVQAHLPSLTAAGFTMVYTLTATSLTSGTMALPDASEEAMAELVAPLLAELTQLGIPFSFETKLAEDMTAHIRRDLGPFPEGAWPSAQLLTSRLIPRTLLVDPAGSRSVAGALREICGKEGFAIAMVAMDARVDGSGSAVPSVADNAVFSAWRDMGLLAVVLGEWLPFTQGASEGNVEEMRRRADVLTNEIAPTLKAVSPDSGVYLNEADIQQQDWQAEFHGDKYPRLLEIKNRYDPHGVFYAHHAVGSERYVTDGEGRLCRA